MAAMDVKVRKMEVADAAACAAIDAVSHRSCWTTAQIQSTLAFAHTLAFVIVEDGAVAGFIIGSAVLEVAEIQQLAVSPRSRKQGFAQKLLQQFQTEARIRQAQRLWLEVRCDNAAALALYTKLNFKKVGERSGFYDDGLTPAYLLQCDI